MIEICSEVESEVPAALARAVLGDFRADGSWNPLIRGILGHPVPGARRTRLSLAHRPLPR
ncbi:MAG: hypothetical protein U5L03_05460 [Burkholderiaceae bacterium]|nr:hypothetical protein [Burkholderiaceae bacterium]